MYPKEYIEDVKYFANKEYSWTYVIHLANERYQRRLYIEKLKKIEKNIKNNKPIVKQIKKKTISPPKKYSFLYFFMFYENKND